MCFLRVDCSVLSTVLVCALRAIGLFRILTTATMLNHKTETPSSLECMPKSPETWQRTSSQVHRTLAILGVSGWGFGLSLAARFLHLWGNREQHAMGEGEGRKVEHHLAWRKAVFKPLLQMPQSSTNGPSEL